MNDQQQQQPSGSRRQSTVSMTSLASLSTMDPPMMHPEEEEMDLKHLQKIIAALRQYSKYSHSRVNKSKSFLNSLPQHHRHMLEKYKKNLSVVHGCIDDNQAVINKMIRDRESTFFPYASQDFATTQEGSLWKRDVENVQSTLKQFARDWSLECAEEREQSYKPIIDAIEEYFNPDQSMELNEVKVLVPGAGLGRLAYELACRGYECEGNEFSYFMLFASNFVLNNCTKENEYTIYPWVHQYVNNLRRGDQTAPVHFPDVCPIKNPPKGNIIMSSGDFLEVYTIPNSYNCVATCFFIDCANNIIEFIETIYRILVPGGIWVNLGPLLYHFSDVPGESSIEPTHEDLIEIIETVGFQIMRSETGHRTKYAQNPRSMLKSEYESLFWVCQKPMPLHDAEQSQVNGDAEEVIVVRNPYHNGYDKDLKTL